MATAPSARTAPIPNARPVDERRPALEREAGQREPDPRERHHRHERDQRRRKAERPSRRRQKVVFRRERQGQRRREGQGPAGCQQHPRPAGARLLHTRQEQPDGERRDESDEARTHRSGDQQHLHPKSPNSPQIPHLHGCRSFSLARRAVPGQPGNLAGSAPFVRSNVGTFCRRRRSARNNVRG